MLEVLKVRRSIRKFKEKKIEKEKIEQLIKAVLLSPSSRNLRPWEFIIVDNKESLKKLSLSKEHGSSFLKDAALGIVVIADSEKCNVWIEDCSIAAIILQLTAETINLGSCWIQIRERWHDTTITAEEYVKKVLDISDKYKVESIIAIGYPNEIRAAHDESQLEYNSD